MLKRIHVKGYKSLDDVEVRLSPLSVLFGPNASGKSNFLDALQLLARFGTSKTLKDAFDPPYRGKPLESFSFGEKGIEDQINRERLVFSIEADLHLSDAVVAEANRRIQEKRHPSGLKRVAEDGARTSSPQVRKRDLRYRLEVEMIPKSGILRVVDEYLSALDAAGEPVGKPKPYIERHGSHIRLRLEGQAHPAYYERYLDRTVLSMPHYPPHYPHLTAVRHELENWLFFYFEPRERMRAANPVKEVSHIGTMGEDLAAFLNTLRAEKPQQFDALEKALHTVIPDISGIDVGVSSLGEVELRVKENDAVIPARVLSEGTLRVLGLLALAGSERPPALVGFEEPENGVHPGRVELIANLLDARRGQGLGQYIVTTHSPVLLDLLPPDSLFVVRRADGKTQITPFSEWGLLGPLSRERGVDRALDDRQEITPVSERLLRGDFDA